MSGESTKKIAMDSELSQLLEAMKMLYASMESLVDSVEDLYLRSDMPTAIHSKDATLDLISRIKR
jgi:hypothetical protein